MNYTIQRPKKDELTRKGFTKRIKLTEGMTAERLLQYGFSNHHAPTLYFGRMVGPEISFNLVVDKKSLFIKNIDVLDEDFLQPYDYQAMLMRDQTHPLARQVFDEVDKVLSKLQDDGILNGYVRGMYI